MNEQDIATELVSLADGMGRGESLDLSDRDDLSLDTMVELKLLLTRQRNAIDTVTRSLAQHWYEKWGESGFVDPETGVIGYVAPRMGEYLIEDGDGFAEWLRTLDNEQIVNVISKIRVSGIPQGARKATLSQRVGAPAITVTHEDNPKAPKWVQEEPAGEVVVR